MFRYLSLAFWRSRIHVRFRVRATRAVTRVPIKVRLIQGLSFECF